MVEFHLPPIPPVDPSRQTEHKHHSELHFNNEDIIGILICLILFKTMYKMISTIGTI